jgi:hypothetical protein
MNQTFVQLFPLAVGLAIVGFDLFCLSRLSKTDETLYMPKLQWAAVIVFLGPFGGMAFLALGRRP